MSWVSAFNRVVSAALLAAAGFGLYLLVPGSNIAGLDRAAVLSAQPLALDRNVYLYDGTEFRRAGVVVRSFDGRGHTLEVLDGILDCDCMIAAVARPDVRAFLRMQTPADQTALREELSQAVLEFVGDVFALMQADPDDPTEDILARALEDALQSPDVVEAQSAVGVSLRNHVGGDIPGALGGILVSRVTDAVKVVVADASENYGLDLVRGEFDTGPFGHAVDGMLSDPRFIEIVSETTEAIVADPAVGHAARLLASEYAKRLFDAMLSTDDLPPLATGVRPEQAVGEVLGWVEDQVYRDGVAHPVVLAMAHNVLLPKSPRNDGILVLMAPAVASVWFASDDILPLTRTWKAIDAQG